MTATTVPTPVTVPVPAPPRGRRGATLAGLATVTASAGSNQVGAAVGAHAFAAIGPAGVVAVRQVVAATVLLPAVRPNFRRFTWAQWWPTLLLGVVFMAMNLCLYTAAGRHGQRNWRRPPRRIDPPDTGPRHQTRQPPTRRRRARGHGRSTRQPGRGPRRASQGPSPGG